MLNSTSQDKHEQEDAREKNLAVAARKLKLISVYSLIGTAVVCLLLAWTMVNGTTPWLAKSTWYPLWSGVAVGLLNGLSTLLSAFSVRSRIAKWWRCPLVLCVLAFVSHTIFLSFSIATPFICATTATNDQQDLYNSTTGTCEVTAATVVFSVVASSIALSMVISEVIELQVFSQLIAIGPKTLRYEVLTSIDSFNPDEEQNQAESYTST